MTPGTECQSNAVWHGILDAMLAREDRDYQSGTGGYHSWLVPCPNVPGTCSTTACTRYVLGHVMVVLDVLLLPGVGTPGTLMLT